jgi:hypothetical protein
MEKWNPNKLYGSVEWYLMESKENYHMIQKSVWRVYTQKK